MIEVIFLVKKLLDYMLFFEVKDNCTLEKIT